LSLKYKLLILLIVVAAAAVIVFPGIKPGDEPDGGSSVEVGDYSDHDNPYRYYLEARQAGKPLVLEFYARW